MIISVCCMQGSGIPHCPKCGREIKKQTIDQMVDQLMDLPGADKNPAACTGCARQKGRAYEAFAAGQEKRICESAHRRQSV